MNDYVVVVLDLCTVRILNQLLNLQLSFRCELNCTEHILRVFDGCHRLTGELLSCLPCLLNKGLDFVPVIIQVIANIPLVNELSSIKLDKPKEKHCTK